MRSGWGMLAGRRARAAEVGPAWCREPDQQLDPGAPEAPPIVAPSWGSTQTRLCKARAPRSAVTQKEERRWTCIYRALLWAGRAQARRWWPAVVTPGPDGTPRKEIRTFGTMTDGPAGAGRLAGGSRVTHVAMESTGVYWKPVWNLLEDSFTLLLVNARHVKAVPGRKTDVRDCEWLADLLRHGLLRASFVPDRPQRELRELTRYRTALVRERTRGGQPAAEDAGRGQHQAGRGGHRHPGQVGAGDARRAGGGQTGRGGAGRSWRRGGCGRSCRQLERALVGRVGPHQRFLVAAATGPHRLPGRGDRAGERRDRGARARRTRRRSRGWMTIPGVGPPRGRGAWSRRSGPTWAASRRARHLASWAGMCPGNHESAGKRRSGKTRKGSPWLRALLVQAAHAAARTKGTYLAAQYRRLAARRGKKRAAVAVGPHHPGHRLPPAHAGHRLPGSGGNYFDERDRQTVERRLVHRLGEARE